MSETTKIHRLSIAEPEHKQRMLARLEEVRREVESGKTIALFVAEVQPNREFLTTCVGEMSGLETLGMLHRMLHHVNAGFGEGRDER